MNLTDLSQQIDDQRRDTTSNFVDSDEIKRYFNQCGRNLQGDHNFDFTITSAVVNFTSGYNSYALSAIGNNDFKGPIDLFADYANQFEFVSPEDFNILKNRGSNIWAIDGGQMLISNNTTVTALSATYYSTFMAQTSGGSWIAELSAGSDSPLMPSRHQDVLVFYALRQIFGKEGLTEDYGMANANYEKKIKDLKNEYISKKAMPLKRMVHINERNVGSMYDKREGFML